MRNPLSRFTAQNKEKMKEEEAKEQIILPIGPEVSSEKRTITSLFHEEDREFWWSLAPHLDTLALRMGKLFTWKSYVYAKIKTDEGQYQEFVDTLRDNTFLFIPCTSANFLTEFWKNCQRNPPITAALTTVYTQPIPFRASSFVSQSILPRPLAAYTVGHERDEACACIIASLEEKLRNYVERQALDLTPILTLAETTKALASAHR